MKKIFILMVTLSMLLSFNANAGKTLNFNDLNGFAPKIKTSDHNNSQKLKTIQKLFNTKIGKWVLKKAIKKLQKNSIKNGIKGKKATKNKANIIVVSLIICVLLGGIKLLIDGYTALGVILGILGLVALIIFLYFASLTSNN